MRVLIAVVAVCVLACGVMGLEEASVFCKGVRLNPCGQSQVSTLVWVFDGTECTVVQQCAVTGDTFDSGNTCKAVTNYICNTNL